MKRIILYVTIILFIFGTGTIWAQEEEKNPVGSISFILTNSFAPIGLGAEFFLGNFGLGGTFTTFIAGTEGGIGFLVEPGAYVRYYFGDLESTFFFMGGVSYLTAGTAYEGDVDALDFGLLKINTGVGYHAMMGKKAKGRFSIEMGPRYRIITDPNEDANFPLLLHFMLTFGTIF
jgi:hypothetical protein